MEPRKLPVSPETALANDLFDQFCNASTFKSILNQFRHLCEVLRMRPTNFPHFYPKLKAHLRTWKAQALWSKFEKRASHKCYNRGKSCVNTRVLIVGGGPCGLRAAIEAQLLGAKVVVIEKRERFSRNNVLHLWPFVIHDLRALGAKKFFGKFCAGAIDHISIRQLQCILLKVALLLGVEVHVNVAFEGLVEPSAEQEEKLGWRARVSPADHPVAQYEFDVLICADGKRNTLEGFKRKEFRGKLAIAITANFINRHSEAEARVEEISGVAFIFNQKFFKDLYEATGIDLENIVYYKDETHYFVMTAKKHSLIDKGVIISDQMDTARLLAPDNVNREALMEYAREAADFSTNNQLPHNDFALNHYGQPDVAMFDFTSMYAAENASRVVERNGHKLLMVLVGDSLLEPFWPTGSGCARGFLSCLDACWVIRSWASGHVNPLEVLAERESIYRLLGQTTPENLNRDFGSYSLDPHTRYPNLNIRAVSPIQVRLLYDTDIPANLEQPAAICVAPEMPKKRRRRVKDSQVHPDTLLLWLKRQVALYDGVSVEDMTSSFKNGLALCAIIYRYRPDLIDFHSLKPEDMLFNNQLAFETLERELGIPPVMTAQEMAQCDVPDILAMMSYLSQVYDVFRGEIPHVKMPKTDENEVDKEALNMAASAKTTQSGMSRPQRQVLLARLSGRLASRKRSSLDREGGAGAAGTSSTQGASAVKGDTLRRQRKRKSVDKEKILQTLDRDSRNGQDICRPEGVEDFSGRVKELEQKLRGTAPTEKKPKDLMRAIGKIDKSDWNIQIIERKIQESKINAPSKKDKKESVPKWNRETFDDKFQAMAKRIHGDEVHKAPVIAAADDGLKKLERKLREGSSLELGQRGSNKVSAMAEQFSSRLNKEDLKVVPLQKSNSKPVLNLPSTGGSEICHFCRKRVYLMERLSAEGLFFHRGCFKCEYCKTTLRLGNYAFEREGSRFFCMPHLGLAGLQRWKMRRRSEELEMADKENIPEPRARTPSPTRSTTELPGLIDLESELDARGTTPERVEFENLAGDVSEEEGASEMDEDEWTDRNFGASAAEMGSSESLSDLSDSEEEGAGEVFEEAMEQPLTLDQTRQLAESWTRRYSKSVPPGQEVVDEDEEDDESASDEYGESDEEFSYEEYDNEEDDSETATEGEEEIRARELRKQEVKLNVPDPPPRRDSETGSETEVGSEEETSTESESSEEEDSATEIETDPEFDDDNKKLPLPHHEIPTILINSKGLGLDETESRSASLTNLHADNNGISSVHRVFPRPPAYRRDLLNRTHSTEGIASKLSLELKKKYLLGGTGSGNNVKKSGSASVLDSKFKSFVDMISEHQKLLNPAPQPSASMQAFLEGTAKLRANPLSPPSSISPVAQLNKDNEKESTERSKELSKIVDQSAINSKSERSTDTVLISRLCSDSDRDKNDSRVNGVCDLVNNAKESAMLIESKTEQSLISDQSKIENYNRPHDVSTDNNRGCEEMEVKDIIIVGKNDRQLLENVDDVRPRSPAHETSIIVPELKPRLESVDSCKDSLSESDSLSFGEDSGNEAGTSVHLHLSEPPRVEVGISQGILEDSFEPDSLEPGNERSGLRLDGLSSGRSSGSSSKGSPDSLRGGGGGMTETEMSDWARDTDANSVGEDLEIELNIDPAKVSVKEKRAKIARPDEFDDEYLGEYQNVDRDLVDVVIVPKQAPPPLVKSAFLPNVDNIEFMDLGDSASSPDEASEARRNGYMKLYDDDNLIFSSLSENNAVNETSDAEKLTESSDTTVSISGSTSQTPDTEFSPVEAVNRNLVAEEEESLLPEAEDTTNSDVTTVVDTPKASNSGVTLENTLSSSIAKRTSKSHDSNMNTYDEYVQSIKGRISPFSNVRDSIDIRKSRKVPTTPRRNELIALEKEDKRFMNSPGTSRKLEEISRERSKQKDLIKELVMEKIGPRSVEKKNRRNSRGSLSPSGSRSPIGSTGPQSRQGSHGSLLSSQPIDEMEDQCFSACNRMVERRVPPLPEDCLVGSQDLYGVPFADDSAAEDSLSYSSKHDRYQTPMTSFKQPLQHPLSVPSKCSGIIVKNSLPDTPLTNPEAFNVHARRDIFRSHNQSTPLSSSSHDLYKTPYQQTPATQEDVFYTSCLSTEDRSKAREEARARARLKSDRELGLSPADYASSLKEKIHRKGSLTDIDNPQEKDKRRKSSEFLADECALESSPPPIPPLPQAYVDSGMIRRTSDNVSDNDDCSKANPSTPTHESSSVSAMDGLGSLSRRQSKMALRIARQAELKRLRMAQEMQRQFEELEVKQRVLEERGVLIEKALRGEETGGDREESELLQEWFEMMRERSELRRYEKELTVRIEELKLEDQRARLEQELRERMSKDESSKTESDVEKEGRILADMLEIVEKRDSLIAVLEEDRQRYQAEDKDFEAQMLKKGLQLTPIRKESHV